VNTFAKVHGGAKRLAEVGTILAKYGLAEWLEGSKLDWVARRFRDGDGERLQASSTGERVRLALVEIGTTGIKLGQMLSTRADLLGPELTRELSKLQAHTPPDSAEVISAMIEAELGLPPAKLLVDFEAEPFASASIGQVHRARLPSGEAVVVKVIHDGIEGRVRLDLYILGVLSELAEKHSPLLKQYQPVATAKQFSRTLMAEMDFGHERRNLDEFASHFSHDPTVIFPSVYPEFCSRRVLTMALVDGIPVSDHDGLEASGEDLKEFARRGAVIYLEMLFRDGFYHADPHPGNLMLLPGNVVGILDGGMVGRVDDVLRDEIEALLIAAITPDPSQLVEIICRLGKVPAKLDRDALRAELSQLLAEYSNQRIDQFDLGGALERVTALIRSYHILLPEGFVMVLKTLVMLEGTSRQLDPSFSLADLLKPYCKLAMKRRLEPRRVMQELTRTLGSWRRLIDALPRDLGDILSRIRTENIEVHLEHRGLESTVDRLVQGILTSALFVGSALILSRAVPPVVGGVSLLGSVGCLISLVLAARLLRAIRQSEKRRR
jgi:ubiquinone biosynthesis protein